MSDDKKPMKIFLYGVDVDDPDFEEKIKAPTIWTTEKIVYPNGTFSLYSEGRKNGVVVASSTLGPCLEQVAKENDDGGSTKT